MGSGPSDDMTMWREQFLVVILRVVFWFGLLTAIPSIGRAAAEGMWSIVVVDMAAITLVFFLARRTGWPYRLRSLCLVGLAYALGVFFLLKVGPVSLIYLMAFPMLVALLLGVRPAALALALNATTLLGVGYLADAELTLPGFADLPFLKWVVITLNFTFIDGVITMATGLMVQRLEQLLREVRQKEEEVRQLNAGLEERVRERTLQLQAVNQELEAFSYAVSHDLRSPLGTLNGFSGLLEKHVAATDERGRHYLARVRAAAHHMGELIDAMLMLSSLTRAKLRHEAVDLSAIALGLTAAYQEAAPARRVQVEVQPGIQAVGDPRLLRQVLDNLLGNAWKFSAVQPQARIAFRQEVNGQGETVYEVRDNGAGFDMAQADKLFHAFHRLHAAEEFAGTGIGLATVQRIIARHGGRVWAESAPGQGASFRFTLGNPT